MLPLPSVAHIHFCTMNFTLLLPISWILFFSLIGSSVGSSIEKYFGQGQGVLFLLIFLLGAAVSRQRSSEIFFLFLFLVSLISRTESRSYSLRVPQKYNDKEVVDYEGINWRGILWGLRMQIVGVLGFPLTHSHQGFLWVVVTTLMSSEVFPTMTLLYLPLISFNLRTNFLTFLLSSSLTIVFFSRSSKKMVVNRSFWSMTNDYASQRVKERVINWLCEND